MNENVEGQDQALIVLRGLEGNQPPNLSGAQAYLSHHLPALELMWWIVFLGTLGVVVVRALFFSTPRP